tara:strand:- start:1176 stop:1451 length:276 start_codon:yes stop_codon:yes gene_type:complete
MNEIINLKPTKIMDKKMSEFLSDFSLWLDEELKAESIKNIAVVWQNEKGAIGFYADGRASNAEVVFMLEYAKVLALQDSGVIPTGCNCSDS